MSAGAYHTLALSSFTLRGERPNPLREAKMDDDEKAELFMRRLKDNMHYEPFGKDDLTKQLPTYLVNDRGVTTDKEVRPMVARSCAVRAPFVWVSGVNTRRAKRSPGSCTRQVTPRANELWAWGWNGFGELGTGDELPRLSPVRVETMLPASTLCIAAGSHHSLVLTSGYAVRVKEDNQRPFKGYGPYIKKIEAVIEQEVRIAERWVAHKADDAGP